MSSFLWIGTILAFFHSKGKLFVLKQVLTIILRGLQIESTHIFSIGILILSWPWALFGSRLLIIRKMSHFVKRQKIMCYLYVLVIQKVRRVRLKLKNIGQREKNWKSHFFLESKRYIYHHEIEEECREFFFRLTVTVFSRATSSTYC